MNRRLALVGGAMTAVTCAAATAEPSLECSFVESSQVEIADCLAETEERVELAMELVLGYVDDIAFDIDEVTTREVAKPALAKAQTEWLAYRDAHCDFRGALSGGGSGSGIAIRSCRIELTRARTRELYRFID